MDDLVDLLTYRCPITNGWRCAVPESALANHGYKLLGFDTIVGYGACS